MICNDTLQIILDFAGDATRAMVSREFYKKLYEQKGDSGNLLRYMSRSDKQMDGLARQWLISDNLQTKSDRIFDICVTKDQVVTFFKQFTDKFYGVCITNSWRLPSNVAKYIDQVMIEITDPEVRSNIISYVCSYGHHELAKTLIKNKVQISSKDVFKVILLFSNMKDITGTMRYLLQFVFLEDLDKFWRETIKNCNQDHLATFDIEDNKDIHDIFYSRVLSMDSFRRKFGQIAIKKMIHKFPELFNHKYFGADIIKENLQDIMHVFDIGIRDEIIYCRYHELLIDYPDYYLHTILDNVTPETKERVFFALGPLRMMNDKHKELEEKLESIIETLVEIKEAINETKSIVSGLDDRL